MHLLQAMEAERFHKRFPVGVRGKEEFARIAHLRQCEAYCFNVEKESRRSIVYVVRRRIMRTHLHFSMFHGADEMKCQFLARCFVLALAFAICMPGSDSRAQGAIGNYTFDRDDNSHIWGRTYAWVHNWFIDSWGVDVDENDDGEGLEDDLGVYLSAIANCGWSMKDETHAVLGANCEFTADNQTIQQIVGVIDHVMYGQFRHVADEMGSDDAYVKTAFKYVADYLLEYDGPGTPTEKQVVATISLSNLTTFSTSLQQFPQPGGPENPFGDQEQYNVAHSVGAYIRIESPRVIGGMDDFRLDGGAGSGNPILAEITITPNGTGGFRADWTVRKVLANGTTDLETDFEDLADGAEFDLEIVAADWISVGETVRVYGGVIDSFSDSMPDFDFPNAWEADAEFSAAFVGPSRNRDWNFESGFGHNVKIQVVNPSTPNP